MFKYLVYLQYSCFAGFNLGVWYSKKHGSDRMNYSFAENVFYRSAAMGWSGRGIDRLFAQFYNGHGRFYVGHPVHGLTVDG